MPRSKATPRESVLLSQRPSRSHSPFTGRAREEHKILGCVSSWLDQQTEGVPGSAATDSPPLEGTEPPRLHCKCCARPAGCRHPLFQLQLLAGALPKQWCLHGNLVTKSAQFQWKNRKHTASPKPQALQRGKSLTYVPSGLRNTPNKPQSTECKLQQPLAGSFWLCCTRLHTVALQGHKDTRQGAGWLLRMPRAGGSSGNEQAPRAALDTEASVPHNNGNTTRTRQRSCDITAAAHAKNGVEGSPASQRSTKNPPRAQPIAQRIQEDLRKCSKRGHPTAQPEH